MTSIKPADAGTAAAFAASAAVAAVPGWAVVCLVALWLVLRFVVDLVSAGTPLLLERERTRRAELDRETVKT